MPYATIAQEVAKLVQEKQTAYGDSFGKSGQVMRILYPDGIPPEKLDDALTVTRILDKLFRIATDRDALGEDPWRDINGYSLLAVERQERKKGPRCETCLWPPDSIACDNRVRSYGRDCHQLPPNRRAE